MRESWGGGGVEGVAMRLILGEQKNRYQPRWVSLWFYGCQLRIVYVELWIEIYFLLSIVCLFEPAHEIMVLIAQGTREGSGEPAHPHSLARAFAGRTPEV